MAGLSSYLRSSSSASFGRPARAETIEEAIDAYLINPVLNAERARLRATDEQVAFAKSGLRPFIFGTADTAFQNRNTTNRRRQQHSAVRYRFVNRAGQQTIPAPSSPHPSQEQFPLTRHSVKQRGHGGRRGDQSAWLCGQSDPADLRGLPEPQRHQPGEGHGAGAREALRTVEQTVLLNAATAYVNVVRDQAVVRLRENDVSVLTEQLKATKDRFDVGEVTRTDVAQAEARRSDAITQLAAAKPTSRRAARPTSRSSAIRPAISSRPLRSVHLLPSTLDEAMTLGRRREPLHPERRLSRRRPRSTT